MSTATPVERMTEVEWQVAGEARKINHIEGGEARSGGLEPPTLRSVDLQTPSTPIHQCRSTSIGRGLAPKPKR